MKTLSLAVLALLVLLVGPTARAEDPPIPGLQMDEVSKTVVEAWRKKTARSSTHYAQAPVLVLDGRLPDRPPMVEGTYRFELVEGKIEWGDAARGRMMEQAWWRIQLDWILREPGLLFYLAHSTLTGEKTAQGTTVRVTGRSPFKVLRFDANGDLVGLTSQQTGPGGAVQDADVRLEHRRLGEHVLLDRYVMETVVPGGPPMKEVGRLDWALVHGTPMPREFVLALQQGRQKADLVVKVKPWKVGDEAHCRMDLASAVALRTWEARAYNLGRRGIAKARCDVALEVEPGGAVVRGTYVWDGEKGSVTWQDPKAGLAMDPPWHASLDQMFRRYWMREYIGVRELTASKEGGRTEVRVVDPYRSGEPIGYRSLTFGSDGALARISCAPSDGTVGVLEPTWHRVVYPKNHVFAGMLQYEVPATWKATWKDLYGDTFTRTRSFRYVAQDGLHVPSRLEVRTEEAGVPATTRVLTFRSWKLVRAPRLPRR